MPESYKRLGAIAPADDKEYLLYTAPDGTQSLISNITVANRSSSSASFDINVYESGVTQQSDLDDDVSYTFVAFAPNSNETAISTDGITWTAGTMPSSQLWGDVTYGDGVFVAVAYNSAAAATSTDGITWTARTMPASSDWISVTHGDNKFVAVAYTSSQVAYSTDGISWSSSTLNKSIKWRSIAYGNDTFVAVSYPYPPSAETSTDGITWTSRTMPTSLFQGSYAIAYGSGIFLCIATMYTTPGSISLDSPSDAAATSTDGITWTSRTMPSTSYWTTVSYANDRFVALSYGGGEVATTTDGINWTSGTMPSTTVWSSVTYGNNTFVATGYQVAATSTDAITWTARTMPSTNWWYSSISKQNLIEYSSPPLNNLYKSSLISPNETQILEPGIALSASASIVAKDNSGGNLTFSTYGVELS